MYTFLDIKVDNIIPIIINKNMYFFFREKKALFTKKRITKEIITAFIKFALSPDIQIQITIKQKNIFDNNFFLELFLKDLNKKPETKNAKPSTKLPTTSSSLKKLTILSEDGLLKPNKL